MATGSQCPGCRQQFDPQDAWLNNGNCPDCGLVLQACASAAAVAAAAAAVAAAAAAAAPSSATAAGPEVTVAAPLGEVEDGQFNTVVADQADAVDGAGRADAESQTPTRLDELLAEFAKRNPSIARDIGETAACSLRFEFLQECTRPGGTKDRRREIWHAMGEEDRCNLSQAPSLSDGEHDQFFLKIVEQDRLMRAKLDLPLREDPPQDEQALRIQELEREVEKVKEEARRSIEQERRRTVMAVRRGEQQANPNLGHSGAQGSYRSAGLAQPSFVGAGAASSSSSAGYAPAARGKAPPAAFSFPAASSSSAAAAVPAPTATA
eukprot:CAMPEP_0203930352 /NCGR_PEP_ID=MMETSP0359-20131031/69115_1 /ASSEMBLY_ACC=CAM_ASM_000338 /TAXON_ID=268821 /ORGANISM="Scrippsiella Hangoei, Strain SHTV-5" /LENGTH=321 /DNA_ID=CAMNT_0050859525 /DNA_START=39 /DNA_END=1001 /DNA_ORIENTATION=+